LLSKTLSKPSPPLYVRSSKILIAEEKYSDTGVMHLMAMPGKRGKFELREVVADYHLKFLEKYLLANHETRLEYLKYSSIRLLEKIK